MFSIANDSLTVAVDEKRGSRITSLIWGGLEFVVQERPSLMDWGWYVMVPWAGRIKDGVIKNLAGDDFYLPTNWEPPHAEHGFGFFSAWERTSSNSTRLLLPRPYAPAFAEQKFEIFGSTLRWTIEYTPNGCDIPAWVGFHPWFLRRLERGGDAELEFIAEKMLVRGLDALPTGEYSAPKPLPWDDAFTGVQGNPNIVWPGAARVVIESAAPWWVVYTENEVGICVEPQSAPPDAANLGISGAHQLEVVFTFTSA